MDDDHSAPSSFRIITMLQKMGLILVLIIFQCSLCMAQQTNHAEFYPEGYVRSLMSVPQSFDQSTVDLSTGDTQQAHSKQASEPKLNGNVDSTQVMDAKPPKDNPVGVKVKRIGALFNTENQSEMEKNLATIIATANQINVRLGQIYFIITNLPDLSNAEEWMRPAAMRGAKIHFKLSPPEEYTKVKSTPSWIISTSKGDVMLEGVLDPRSYFNSHGEFVEPETDAAAASVAVAASDLSKVAAASLAAQP